MPDDSIASRAGDMWRNARIRVGGMYGDAVDKLSNMHEEFSKASAGKPNTLYVDPAGNASPKAPEPAAAPAESQPVKPTPRAPVNVATNPAGGTVFVDPAGNARVPPTMDAADIAANRAGRTAIPNPAPAGGANPAPDFVNDTTKPGYKNTNPAAQVGEAGSVKPGGAAKVGSVMPKVMSGLAAPVAIGTELFDPNVRDAINPNSDMTGMDRLRQAGRSSLRVGGGILGAAAGGLVGGPAALLTGAAGGYAGYEAGNSAADYLFGDQKPAAKLAANAAPAAAAAAPAAPTAPPGGYGGPGNAGIRSGQAMPAGYGVIRNNQTGATQTIGNNGTFDGLGPMPANATQEQAAEWLKKTNVINQQRAATQAAEAGGGVGGDGGSVAAVPGLSSGGGAAAALMAFGAGSRLRQHDAQIENARNANAIKARQLALEYGLKGAESARADKKLGMEEQQQDATSADKAISDFARGQAGERKTATLGIGGEDDKAYEARIGTEASKIKSEFGYSANGRGVKVSDLHKNPRMMAEMQDGYAIKQAVKKDQGFIENMSKYARGGVDFDSRDVLSYRPKTVELRGAPGGGAYNVTMANGTKVPVQFAGGTWNFFGTKDPINADIVKYVQPLVNDFEAKNKGK